MRWVQDGKGGRPLLFLFGNSVANADHLLVVMVVTFRLFYQEQPENEDRKSIAVSFLYCCCCCCCFTKRDSSLHEMTLGNKNDHPANNAVDSAAAFPNGPCLGWGREDEELLGGGHTVLGNTGGGKRQDNSAFTASNAVVERHCHCYCYCRCFSRNYRRHCFHWGAVHDKRR